MPITFNLPRRLELKLAKLADAREERDRLEDRIATLEQELFSYGFHSLIREVEDRGSMPAVRCPAIHSNRNSETNSGNGREYV